MYRTTTCIVLCLGFGAWLHAVDPLVSNVLAQQRAGTKLVDITYTVVDADTATLTVTLAISSDGGATWTVPCAHATGNGIGAAVTPGTAKAIAWDAGADWNGQWSEHMRVRVTADDTAAGPAGDYLVIDLSAGPTATAYPVSYVSVLSVLSDPAYKTTKIVLRRIPGTPPYVFTMGSPIGELGRDSDEPQHQVTLTQGFYMGGFRGHPEAVGAGDGQLAELLQQHQRPRRPPGGTGLLRRHPGFVSGGGLAGQQQCGRDVVHGQAPAEGRPRGPRSAHRGAMGACLSCRHCHGAQ
jgi:hypothetical protein